MEKPTRTKIEFRLVHVPASANPSAACTTPREKEDISDEDPSADDPVEEGTPADTIVAVSVASVEPVTVITGPPHRRREAAALPDKDWRSDDLATNEDPLTNTDHLLDEEIANPRGEGSDFTFEEPIRIDKKVPTVLRNGNDGTQPQKQERQKEKTLRGEFAPAYQRTLSSPRIIWVKHLAPMINALRYL
ncbi:hypothetical protein E4U09_006163 [Claviceps aff. purpurea]|uniref:Uncharacterized protein n=1 Tax=Claviceps aff. purpurea TaxID=1967640 RepID=A0A9P7QN31_9HYPO|nr:hypothetical protein E4U09_006163 [Claviceps aff. purpurea]